MADEDVGEEQAEQPAGEADQAVETAVEPDAPEAAEADTSEASAADAEPGDDDSAQAEGAAEGAEAEGQEGNESGADGEEASEDAAAGALDAVDNIESQLGEVLSSLDGLAGGKVSDFGSASAPSGGASANIELLRDVQLSVKIELGRSRMYIEDILKLGEGSVVELEKLAGDPVDVFVNDRLVARGEVLVLNDNFCVRIGEIIAQD